MSCKEFDEYQYKEGSKALWRKAGAWGAPNEVPVIAAKRTRAGILGANNTLRGSSCPIRV